MARLTKRVKQSCDFSSGEEAKPCTREANFMLTYEPAGERERDSFVCYRHRWRALEMAQIEEQRARSRGN